MAPPSSPFPASQNKKQASISSFFSKKPSSTPKPPSEPPKSSPPPAIPEKRIEAPPSSDDDDEEPTAPRRNFSSALKRAQTSDSNRATAGPKPKRARRTVQDEDDDDFTPDNDAREPSPEPAVDGRQSPGSVSDAGLNGPRKVKGTERTSKFIFSSSPIETENQNGPDAEEARKAKERLHQKFVKKLGRPDSIAEIKRRNHTVSEEAAEGDEDEDGAPEDDEPQSKSKAKGRGGAAAKKGGHKLTPMEKQIIELKQKHPDTILVVEVGYKFRFFGEDARVAAKELGIVCIPGKFRFDEHPSEGHLDRFAGASFPTHRLHVHVKRLVAAGHKVGVVRQLETAALKKAGDNRNAPFVRKLTNLYTKATYIDDVEGLEGVDAKAKANSLATGYILCLTETHAKGWSTDEKVHIGIVAVQPATGDIIYDDFEDGFMRSEIETRLLHIAPCEFLVVGEVSKATEKIVQHLSGSKRNVFGDQARVERVEKPRTMAAQAYSHISNFYADKMKSGDENSESAATVLDKVHQLSEHVTICLSALITHMTEYGLEHVFDLTKNFQAFSARSHMLLNGNTLSSLEIYQNQTDHTMKGSLFWTMDRTKTRFGQRLLRKWVGRPLLSKAQLEERINAVEELRSGEKIVVTEKLKRLLSQVKTDLEKSLIRIYYQKCTRPELLAVLQTLQRIASEYAYVQSPEKAGFASPTLQEAIASLPLISDDIVNFLDRINLQSAKDDDKYGFFREEHETEDITDHKIGIVSVEHDLKEHKKEIAEKLKKSKVEYVTKSGIEFLVEVSNSEVKKVPASWAKISGTKQVSRFHTPEVIRLLRERDQHKEALAAACDVAFKELLAEIGTKYQSFRDCVQSLATLDCLLSLAEISSQPGYVKPEYTEGICIEVSEGRHPMVEQLLLDSYVPNDISMSTDSTRALLITGPNMGGKSSYVRQAALICIMAQVGSYVPASSAKLGMLDAVFTRMGAFDNMMAGESTFMVELSETADILKQASPRSLVILDELGRGTSTHDGVAIAQAVLDYMVREIKALTLFITHYQNLAKLADGFKDGELKNVHMRFEESKGEGENKWEEITFLYEVGEGVAHRSYGLNVARLANVPDAVLEVAAVKSKELEEVMRRRRVLGLSGTVAKMLEGTQELELDAIVNGIEQL
ncbi:hypothetical protein GTA08_BOTSDO02991 [Neofusicoccum parvum]|uniref:Uncharacterized protein n=1 Tax=Neofusicoccum parvum TaxID=310453 RepID=A0ACB5S6G2_9PEZI|nr:hypothetical protein GTA08_BOTSDO02991 [Neofusicoccum parvum]